MREWPPIVEPELVERMALDDDRTAPALTQTELLDAIARLAIGPEACAEDLARAACEDMSAAMARAAEAVWPRGRRLSGWTAFPGPAEGSSPKTLDQPR